MKFSTRDIRKIFNRCVTGAALVPAAALLMTGFRQAATQALQGGRAAAAAEAQARRAALEAAACGPEHPKIAALAPPDFTYYPDPAAGTTPNPNNIYTPAQLVSIAKLVIEGRVNSTKPDEIGTEVTMSIDKVLKGGAANDVAQGSTLNLAADGGVAWDQIMNQCGESQGPGLNIVPNGSYVVIVIISGLDGRRSRDGSLIAAEPWLWYRIDSDGTLFPLSNKELNATEISSLATFESLVQGQ